MTTTTTQSLTNAERQLLALLAAGLTTEVAGRESDLSERTIRRRMTGICARFGVETRIEAIAEAARRGLI